MRGEKSYRKHLGTDADGRSREYVAKNGTPEENTRKVMEMGCIEGFIGKKDIVIVKPNAMWENFRMTNTNAIKVFIDLVLNIPGFEGEIIIGENNHQ